MARHRDISEVPRHHDSGWQEGSLLIYGHHRKDELCPICMYAEKSIIQGMLRNLSFKKS